jgi:hypothetical protein
MDNREMILLLWDSFHRALSSAGKKSPGLLEPFGLRPQQKHGILPPFPDGDGGGQWCRSTTSRAPIEAGMERDFSGDAYARG